MVKAKWFLATLLWLLPFYVQAANIIAELDRNPVSLGDPVTLRLTADGVVSGEPDFSGLQQDFEIGRRSQSNSFNFTNGVSSLRTTWSLVLYPLHTGTIHIPPIAFGNDQSQALDLQVTDQPQTQAGGAPDVFIEIGVEPEQPYVQQQVIITQRLYYAAQLNSSTLSHPQIESGKGDLRQIGNTLQTSMMHNGRNYNVAERRYALVPQQSGELTISRTRFDGIIAEPGSSSFDPFGLSGQRTRKISDPLTLQVRPQPSGFNGGQWLPARSLTLNADWQTPPDQLKAGEPVTLTLGIVADGLAAEQLPKLNIQVPSGIKAYADQPELRNTAGSDGVIGIRQEKWVIVSPYNGDFELPEMTINWWNTQEDRQETARIDPVSMKFSGGQTAPATQQRGVPSGPDNEASASAEGTDEAVGEEGREAAGGARLSRFVTGWNWVWGAAFLLMLWAVLTLWWVVRRWLKTSRQSSGIKPQPSPISAVKQLADSKSALQRLEKACKQNQPQAAHEALLAWAETALDMHPPLISRLRERVPAQLRSEIDALNTSLYGRSQHSWQGEGLLQAVKAFQPQQSRHADDSGLIQLYPD